MKKLTLWRIDDVLLRLRCEATESCHKLQTGLSLEELLLGSLQQPNDDNDRKDEDKQKDELKKECDR